MTPGQPQAGPSPAEEFLRRRPGCVALVGLGPSANAYWLECAAWNNQVPWDEVWVVNKASAAFRHDAAWNMHDLRDMARNSKAVTERLRIKEADKPVVTVQAYPEYPMSVTYPIMEVLNFVKHDILSSTPAYMVAYAMMIGVKTLYLYGMDFHYQNVAHAEKGGQGMAYLLGMCQAAGIDFKVPQTSSLLAANECVLVAGGPGGTTVWRPLYGYSLTGIGGPPDPRLQAGMVVTPPGASPGQMSVTGPRYRLGEAEDGDLTLNPDGGSRGQRLPVPEVAR